MHKLQARVLAKLSIAMIKHHDQKQIGKQKALFYHITYTFFQGSQGRDLEIGTRAEVMEKCSLLDFSL